MCDLARTGIACGTRARHGFGLAAAADGIAVSTRGLRVFGRTSRLGKGLPRLHIQACQKRGNIIPYCIRCGMCGGALSLIVKENFRGFAGLFRPSPHVRVFKSAEIGCRPEKCLEKKS